MIYRLKIYATKLKKEIRICHLIKWVSKSLVMRNVAQNLKEYIGYLYGFEIVVKCSLCFTLIKLLYRYTKWDYFWRITFTTKKYMWKHVRNLRRTYKQNKTRKCYIPVKYLSLRSFDTCHHPFDITEDLISSTLAKSAFWTQMFNSLVKPTTSIFE